MIHEECGVLGLFASKRSPLVDSMYYGLYALQHRGQESCGIVVNDDGIFTIQKGLGLVNEVFNKETLQKFPEGNMAVGHVRYGTTGATIEANTQPIVVNHQKGKMAIAHNGNLSNAYELRSQLELNGAIFHGTSDTEIIAYIITQERLKTRSIEDAVINAMNRLEGAFSIVLMSSAKMIAVRDPNGFRPLCYGKKEEDYVIASESCALEAIGATFIRDITPGECVVFDENGIHSYQMSRLTYPKKTCIFEYIYFARPDSIIDGISVHKARINAGKVLAKAHPVDADIVVGVPDSGLDAALGYSQESGIPYAIGFIKNKYIGRTFISPGQQSRMNQVKIKLNPIKEVVKDKRVVLIDDSIVRGTTSGQIVSLLREAGAKEVHMRISSPPFKNPCFYGTDIDSRENLIACHHSIDEISRLIGANSLGYLPINDLKYLIDGDWYCDACFSGQYPTSIPEHSNKDRFEMKLSEHIKQKKGGF